MKQTIKNLWEKIVINRYVSAGLRWGDATSYAFIGEAVGYKFMEKLLYFWEKYYKKLGYKPVNCHIWVDAGGYGRDYEQYLRVRK
jgi:hypothetical protein